MDSNNPCIKEAMKEMDEIVFLEPGVKKFVRQLFVMVYMQGKVDAAEELRGE